MSGKLAAAARSVARFQVLREDDLQLLPAGRGAAGTHADTTRNGAHQQEIG